jgi:hypothetical protein
MRDAVEIDGHEQVAAFNLRFSPVPQLLTCGYVIARRAEGQKASRLNS